MSHELSDEKDMSSYFSKKFAPAAPVFVMGRSYKSSPRCDPGETLFDNWLDPSHTHRRAVATVPSAAPSVSSAPSVPPVPPVPLAAPVPSIPSAPSIPSVPSVRSVQPAPFHAPVPPRPVGPVLFALSQDGAKGTGQRDGAERAHGAGQDGRTGRTERMGRTGGMGRTGRTNRMGRLMVCWGWGRSR